MTAQIQKEKVDWPKVVAESGGTRTFLPDAFREDAEKVEKLRKEFNKLIGEVAEHEITMNMATQNMFFEIRKHLAAAGVEIWTKDIGFDTEALKDGVFILNFRENQK